MKNLYSLGMETEIVLREVVTNSYLKCKASFIIEKECLKYINNSTDYKILRSIKHKTPVNNVFYQSREWKYSDSTDYIN